MVCYSGVFYHPGWEEADAKITRLTRDYFDVWTDLAAENFYGALQTWCHDHGLTSVGHQDMDNWTKTLPSVSGHFYKNNRYNDHPGIDVINDNIEIGRFNDFPRFAGSAKLPLWQRARHERNVCPDGDWPVSGSAALFDGASGDSRCG